MFCTKEKSCAWLCCLISTSILSSIGVGMYYTFLFMEKQQQSVDDAEDYLNEHHCTDSNGNSYKDHCGSSTDATIQQSCNEVTYMFGNTSMVNAHCQDKCSTACGEAGGSSLLFVFELIALMAAFGFFSLTWTALFKHEKNSPQYSAKNDAHRFFGGSDSDRTNNTDDQYHPMNA